YSLWSRSGPGQAQSADQALAAAVRDRLEGQSAMPSPSPIGLPLPPLPSGLQPAGPLSSDIPPLYQRGRPRCNDAPGSPVRSLPFQETGFQVSLQYAHVIAACDCATM